MVRLRWSLPLLVSIVVGCGEPKKPEPMPSGRCEVDLASLEQFSQTGTGAKARRIETAADLIGGAHAHGEVGDYLLENDRIRVVIQRPSREASPTPYGGTIVDADLARSPGQRGRDELGKMGLVYAFGRTINATQLEVLSDGARGGAAVIAASGRDTLLDYVDVTTVLEGFLGSGVKLQTDPNAPLSLLATTYYVLSPGETRVRLLTAFCNEGRENIAMQVGDLINQGGQADFFNPTGCVNGLGAKGCLVDPAPWFGYQADGVAYAYRAYKASDLKVPAKSAVLSISGVAAVIADGEDQTGLLAWLDATATRRPGIFGVLPGKSRLFLRDFFVGKDLGELTGTMLALDALPKARLQVSVQQADGGAAPFSRVAIVGAESGKPVTILEADDLGRARVDLPPGNYTAATGAPGLAFEAPKAVTVPSTGEAQITVKHGEGRMLTVRARDHLGRPLTARVVVQCSGPCPHGPNALRRVDDVENLPSQVQAIGFTGSDGLARIPVPPGSYEVFVSRGPEYSGWPAGFPISGQAVDLSTQDGSVEATLAPVVDTTGWLSADLHVHAVNSADSSVPNDLRVASFAAEGVDVMVSTDHDAITDYGPVIRQLGLEGVMASLVGAEVTPFNYGHQNAYPLTVRPGPNGGAYDWGNGEGPSLRLDELYAGLRQAFPDVVVQMNHPRGGGGGSLTTLEVDTATGASHAPPERFRMTPHPQATALDTKLLSPDFDALEVMNGFSAKNSVLNDFMTFTSRGWLKVATAVSDTHTARQATGGYGRTWVEVGHDDVTRFSPAPFAQALKAKKAIGSSGPFVRLTAQRLDGAGQPQGAPVNIGGTIGVSAGQSLRLTVDVQAPEWLQFDTLELHTHAAGREATGGQANDTWPASRIAQKRTYVPTMLPLEPVPGLVGFNARRVHLTETFTVSPAQDTWYLVIVRATNASRGMYPVGWEGVSCSGATCTAAESRAMAFTNPIYVDADGSGAYDTFPLRGQPLRAPPAKHVGPVPRRTPSMAELEQVLRELLHH